MVDTAVRCPYCVLGTNFRQMVAHLDGRFICRVCGHMAMPTNPDFKCSCSKCRELAFPAGLGSAQAS